jgi:hypothetical protein
MEQSALFWKKLSTTTMLGSFQGALAIKSGVYLLKL